MMIELISLSCFRYYMFIPVFIIESNILIVFIVFWYFLFWYNSFNDCIFAVFLFGDCNLLAMHANQFSTSFNYQRLCSLLPRKSDLINSTLYKRNICTQGLEFYEYKLKENINVQSIKNLINEKIWLYVNLLSTKIASLFFLISLVGNQLKI